MQRLILGFIMSAFVMISTAMASDVYITQSGASFTANINQDGQTNKYGVSGTVVTHTGDNQTLDIDQLGNTNTIAGSVIGDSQTLTIKQEGNTNTSKVCNKDGILLEGNHGAIETLSSTFKLVVRSLKADSSGPEP